MRFRYTLVAAILSATFLIAVLVFNVDPIDVASLIHHHVGTRHLDEVAAAALVVVAGLLLDFRAAATRAQVEAALAAQRAHAAAELQEQRLRVLKATMRTVQDIVNNYLNVVSLQTARGGLSPDIALATLTRETAERLRALGDLEQITEREVGGAVVIAYEVQRPPAPPG